MSKLSSLILILLFVNNCSFNENQNIWKNKDIKSENKENIKELFIKDKIDTKETWSVVFAQTAPGQRLGVTDITGEGKPIEVLNKALAAAKEFVKGAKPAYIYFSAKEPSRMKLYNIMVKKLTSSMGFKVLNASQGNYLLQSKRHR